MAWTYTRAQIADQAVAFIDAAKAAEPGSAARTAYITAATNLGNVIWGRAMHIISVHELGSGESPFRQGLLDDADALLVQANATSDTTEKQRLISEAGMLGNLVVAAALHQACISEWQDYT